MEFVPRLRLFSHTWLIRTRESSGTIAAMADESAQSLQDQLEEIGAQLAWVRDYL